MDTKDGIKLYIDRDKLLEDLESAPMMQEWDRDFFRMLIYSQTTRTETEMYGVDKREKTGK